MTNDNKMDLTNLQNKTKISNKINDLFQNPRTNSATSWQQNGFVKPPKKKIFNNKINDLFQNPRTNLATNQHMIDQQKNKWPPTCDFNK
jgi:hypothetical protein